MTFCRLRSQIFFLFIFLTKLCRQVGIENCVSQEFSVQNKTLEHPELGQVYLGDVLLVSLQMP